MWFLIACGGAAVVCAASWLRAGRTRPLGEGRPDMSDAHKDALARSTFNNGQRSGGFTGGGAF